MIADNQTNILTEKNLINNPKTKIIEILILIEEFQIRKKHHQIIKKMVILKLIVFNLVRKLDQKTLKIFKKNHKMTTLDWKIRTDIKKKNLVKGEDLGQKTNQNYLLKDVIEIQILLIEKEKD